MSQTAISQFVSEDIKWKVQKLVFLSTPDVFEHIGDITKTYFFEGDTILNGKNYSNFYYHTDSIRTQKTELKFVSHIRNEGKKVYVYYFNPSSGNQEYLLYDFGRVVNDTLFNSTDDTGMPLYSYVNRIDSMQVEGDFKKLFYIHFGNIVNGDTTDYLSRVLLEDFGDIQKNPTYPFCMAINYDCADELLCIEKNNQTIFMNFNADYCYINTLVATEEAYLEKNILVYPNPSNNFVNISLPDKLNLPANISIYNLQGQLVKREQAMDREISIHLEKFSSGTYILSIQNQKHIITKKIILLNH